MHNNNLFKQTPPSPPSQSIFVLRPSSSAASPFTQPPKEEALIYISYYKPFVLARYCCVYFIEFLYIYY